MSYPGEAASPEQLYKLASAYQKAAIRLSSTGRKGDPLSWAPCRFVALHAIELYLNAYLYAVGADPKTVRGFNHDLASRSELAIDYGLVLRKRTAEHLTKLTDDREYLVTRYGPEMTATLSQINRLVATLDELARKVPIAVSRRSTEAT